MKVLVVDDSSTMVRIVSNTVKRLGDHEILTAADGVLGLEEFKKHDDIDIVLSDINMLNMNGLEMIKEIRALDKNVYIVMITTEGGKKEVVTALKQGCNNYICKPFTLQVLREKLNGIL